MALMSGITSEWSSKFVCSQGQLQASSPHSQASHLPREAGVVLELELIAFFNPWHTLANGSCCRDECSLTCSNRFQFCLQPYQQSREEVGGCVWGRYSTGVVATDSTVFQKGQLLEAGTPNPLVFTAHGWTVSANHLIVD